MESFTTNRLLENIVGVELCVGPLKQTQCVYDCQRGKAAKGNELFGLITEAVLTQTVSARPDKRWPPVREKSSGLLILSSKTSC